MKNKTVFISIGAWHGRSSRAIGDNLHENAVLYDIDTWAGSIAEQETNHASAKMRDGDHAFYEYLQNNFDLIQAGKIIPLRMTSKNAAEFFKEKGIFADFIFIDAGHTYEEVCQDIDSWKEVLKEDGLFCGHDANSWVGVDQAISDKLKSYSVYPGTHIWYTDKSNIHFDPPAVFDVVPFLDELDILELRFETLFDVVDRFILVESTRTHQNKPKELVFEKHLKRFEKYLSKVTYLVQDQFPATDSWSLERSQREKGLEGLHNAKGNDTVLVGDIDEIPNPEVVRSYKAEMGIMSLEQKLYYYNFNCQAQDPWREAKIGPYRLVREKGLCGTRYSQCPSIPNGGWHFSYFGGTDNIIKKIECSAHIENNKEEFKVKDYIEKAVKDGKDLFGRNLQYKYVGIDNSYPTEVYNNRDWYKQKGMIV